MAPGRWGGAALEGAVPVPDLDRPAGSGAGTGRGSCRRPGVGRSRSVRTGTISASQASSCTVSGETGHPPGSPVSQLTRRHPGQPGPRLGRRTVSRGASSTSRQWAPPRVGNAFGAPGAGGQGGLGQDLEASASRCRRSARPGSRRWRVGVGRGGPGRRAGRLRPPAAGSAQLPHPVGLLDQVGLPGPLLGVLILRQPLGASGSRRYRTRIPARPSWPGPPGRGVDQQGLGLGPGDLVDRFPLAARAWTGAGEHAGVGGGEVPSRERRPGSAPARGRSSLAPARRGPRPEPGSPRRAGETTPRRS